MGIFKKKYRVSDETGRVKRFRTKRGAKKHMSSLSSRRYAYHSNLKPKKKRVKY